MSDLLPPLREANSPIPEEVIPYLEEAIEISMVSVFEHYDLTTDTPLNFHEFISENREKIYQAFVKADDLLTEELEKILQPLAKSYADEMIDFDYEDESEG